MVEQLSTILAAHLSVQREITHELDDLSHMIIILREQLSLPLRVEKVVGGEKLEHHTSDTPDVSAGTPVFAAEDGLGCTILPGLDIFRIVFLRRGGVAEVSNLDRDRVERGKGGGVENGWWNFGFWD